MTPFVELMTGAAYRPHPGDAALPLGRRFLGQSLVVVGGGGTALGWTQRIQFDHQGKPGLVGERGGPFNRLGQEWGHHLRSAARTDAAWCLILLEQQWQATLASTSVSSLEASEVERMLRVRESAGEFGDQKISDDAIRAAVDHPTMEGSIVVGAKTSLLEQLAREANAAGFQIAAIRVATFGLLERHLNQLHQGAQLPDRAIVATDGKSALIVGIRAGAFDTGEGRFSYVVNRPSDWTDTVWARISHSDALQDWNRRFILIGGPLSLGDSADRSALDVVEMKEDPILAAVDSLVWHDLRPDLHEMRHALPSTARFVFLGVVALVIAALSGAVFQLSESVRLKGMIAATEADRSRCAVAVEKARAHGKDLQKEEDRARRLATWIDTQDHAQLVLHSFLRSLPADALLQEVALHAAEGLPQSQLKFTLMGSDEAQGGATRAIENTLYKLGYTIIRRDDPSPSPNRRGGILYGWDLIQPVFGSGNSP